MSTIGDDEKLRGIHTRNGFSSLKEYLKAAETKKVIYRQHNTVRLHDLIVIQEVLTSLNNIGHEKSNNSKQYSSTNSSQFADLIVGLNRLGAEKNRVKLCTLGGNTIMRGIHKLHGFQSLQKFIESAEAAGIVHMYDKGTVYVSVELINTYARSVNSTANEAPSTTSTFDGDIGASHSETDSPPVVDATMNSFMPESSRGVSTLAPVIDPNSTVPSTGGVQKYARSNSHYVNHTIAMEMALASIGQEAHLEKFIQNEIDYLMFLELEDNDLKDIGIKALGSRKKILEAIKISKDKLNVPRRFESLQEFIDHTAL